MLNQVFTHAVARGLRADNPVLGTIAREERVQRQRLPKAAFDKIREAAPAWLVRAMDLALYSLQRPEDLVLMQVSDWHNGKLSVRQLKVEGHGTGRLRIEPGPNLLGAIVACLNSPERGDCPYLLHRIPQKKRKAKWRSHFRQLADDGPTREFQRVREELGLFDDLAPEARPSFGEIRALGADEYRNARWPDVRVQSLLGHTDIAMTRVYLDRHGERWQEVEAG